MLIEFPFGGGGGFSGPTLDYYKLKYRKPVLCSRNEYMKLLYKRHIQRVRQKHVGNYWISTVFTGRDINLFGEGSPILFETMIFYNGNDDTKDDDLGYRTQCSTWREALHQHRAAIDWLKNNTKV